MLSSRPLAITLAPRTNASVGMASDPNDHTADFFLIGGAVTGALVGGVWGYSAGAAWGPLAVAYGSSGAGIVGALAGAFQGFVAGGFLGFFAYLFFMEATH